MNFKLKMYLIIYRRTIKDNETDNKTRVVDFMDAMKKIKDNSHLVVTK